MKIEWITHNVVDFPDDEINRICDLLRKGHDDMSLSREIVDVIYNFDNAFYTWGLEQTQEVLNEVKRRTGGVQLNMFKELGME